MLMIAIHGFDKLLEAWETSEPLPFLPAKPSLPPLLITSQIIVYAYSFDKGPFFSYGRFVLTHQ